MPFEFHPIWEPEALLWDDQLAGIFNSNESMPYAVSTASRELRAELRRYAGRRTPDPRFRRPLITGRSVLISGRRGSGKTGAVMWVIRDVQAELLSLAQPVRMLPVPVSASASLDMEILDKDGNDAELHEKLLVELCFALHRAVHREFVARMRAGIGNSSDLSEMLAQFEQDNEDAVDALSFREYWRRFGYLAPDGDGTALFPRKTFGKFESESEKPQLPVNQPSSELNALATFNEIYLRLIGELFSEQREQDKKTVTRSLDGSKAFDGPEWRQILSGLLSGGLVASGTANLWTPAAAMFAGLLTGAATGLGLSLFGVWKQERSRTTNRRFTRDYSINTLNRELPRVIDALRCCGVVPVFLIDELDKREKLDFEIKEILTPLKHFFAEKAFFCFLTHREFLDRLARRENESPAGESTTWFRPVIVAEYLPGDIRAYIRHIVRVRPVTLLVGDPVPDDWLPPPDIATTTAIGIHPDYSEPAPPQGTPQPNHPLIPGRAIQEDVDEYEETRLNRSLWELILVKRAAGSMKTLHEEFARLRLMKVVPDVLGSDDPSLLYESLHGAIIQLVLENLWSSGVLTKPGDLHLATMALSVLVDLMSSAEPIDLSENSDFFVKLAILIEDS